MYHQVYGFFIVTQCIYTQIGKSPYSFVIWNFLNVFSTMESTSEIPSGLCLRNCQSYINIVKTSLFLENGVLSVLCFPIDLYHTIYRVLCYQPLFLLGSVFTLLFYLCYYFYRLEEEHGDLLTLPATASN